MASDLFMLICFNCNITIDIDKFFFNSTYPDQHMTRKMYSTLFCNNFQALGSIQ